MNLFEFHGLELRETNDEHEKKADCPFCGKEDHLLINTETTEFHCVYCDEGGNDFLFLRKLHALSFSKTTKDDYKELSRDRGIPFPILKQHGLARSALTGRWLIPIGNRKKAIINLCVYDGSSTISTAGMKQILYGLDRLTDDTNKTLWLLEGHWDYLAFASALSRSGIRDQHDILAVPGANSFRKTWVSYLTGRNVNVIFDNDHPRTTPNGKTIQPGYDGMKKVLNICRTVKLKPAKISTVQWEGRLPSGYDVRDFCNDLKDEPEEIVPRLERMLHESVEINGMEVDTFQEVEVIERSSFEEIEQDLKKSLYLTPSMQDTIAIMFACHMTLRLKGDPVWMYVVGPSGFGKSTLIECLRASPYSIAIDKLVGIHSGWRVSKEELADAEDPEEYADSGLLRLIQDKALIIKDFTLTLSLPKMQRDVLYGELRDCYDGRSSSRYRNRVGFDYKDINFVLIACVTDEIKKPEHRQSILGERFLQVDVCGDDLDDTEQVTRSIYNTLESIYSGIRGTSAKNLSHVVTMDNLYRASAGFLEHLHAWIETNPLPKVPKEYRLKIRSAAQFVAFLRSDPVQNAQGDLAFKVRRQAGTRVASQLTKLAIGISIVLGKPEVDDEVYRLVHKVVMDTCSSSDLDILLSMMAAGDYETTDMLAKRSRLNVVTVQKRIKSLHLCGLIRQKTILGSSKGQVSKRLVYAPSRNIQRLWRMSEP